MTQSATTQSTTPTAAPPPQPSLIYAPGRPKGLSPLIDHLGPGYVVVKLLPPPMRLEVARLTFLIAVTAGCVAVMTWAPWFLTMQARAWNEPVVHLLIFGLALTGLLLFAVAALWQAQVVVHRLRGPLPPSGSMMFRRPEVATDAGGAHMVLRATVQSVPLGLLRGGRAFLRIETPEGRVFDLLHGHRLRNLKKLEAGLRSHLLSPRPGAPDASEVTA